MSGDLDLLLQEARTALDAPLPDPKPLACPYHGAEHVIHQSHVPGRICAATYEAGGYTVKCGKYPCARCGSDQGSWMSNLCDRCYSAVERERRDEKTRARWEERQAGDRAKRIAVSLEQENADLERRLASALRLIGQFDPTSGSAFASDLRNILSAVPEPAPCDFCGKPADVWPARTCEEPEFHEQAMYDCDCGETVTVAEAIASPSRHRRCSLIGSRS